MENFAGDDFGEVYADLEVEVLSAPSGRVDGACRYIQPEEDDDSDPKNEDDAIGEKEVSDDYIGSDSEDDLKIVLNDEDCTDFRVAGVRNGGIVAGVGCGEDVDGDGDGDGDGFVDINEGRNLGKNGGCGDELPDGLRLAGSNACRDQSKNGVKRGYSSRFFRPKYIRNGGSVFVNNVKANQFMGMASYLSSLAKDGWNGNACIRNQCAANPMAVQCGYGSILPWYWSIFDVNIDTLEEKPWRTPGIDITDYFNFGFNENSWKQYCASLDQLWRTSMQTYIPVNESSKLNQEATREKIGQVVSGGLLSSSSECEVPKGRAIQVEDSLIERQPSVDVRRPQSRDSDVIIQIKVHESSDDYSGSANSNVLDASEEGEFIIGNNRNDSSSEHTVLSEEHLKDVKKSEDSSVQERNILIPAVHKDEYEDQVDQHSEDNAEAREGDVKAKEGASMDACCADPCWIEPELSLGDQELSLTSYPDSDSEETEGSVHVDNKKTYSPLRRHSMNSDTNLKGSLPLYHKASKNNSFNRATVNKAYYSRNRGTVRQEWRHLSGRHETGSKLNKHIKIDNGFSHIPRTSVRDLPLPDLQYDNYESNHKRRAVSYNREINQSCFYCGEKVVDDLFRTVHSKHLNMEDRGSFRKKATRHLRKNWDDRECFSEQRTLMAHNGDNERDWYHADRGHSPDGLSPLPYRESRQYLPKNSSFIAKGRDVQRRRMHENPNLRDRSCDDDKWVDEFEFEYLNRSHRLSTSSTEREMESFNNRCEEQFQHFDGALVRSSKSGRLHDRHPLVLDNLGSGKIEDECLKYIHQQTSNLKYCRKSYSDSVRNYACGTRVNENYGRFRRYAHTRISRGNDWLYDYSDAAEDEDHINFAVKECKFYSPPTGARYWNEDEVTFRHRELHSEEDTLLYEETPRHEMRARYGSLHAKVQIDDLQLQQQHLNMPRSDNDSFLIGSSKIVCGNKHGQAVLRCRKSVGLVYGDRKSHARSSRVPCNGSLKNVERGVTKMRTALVNFDHSQGNAIKSDISKSENDHESRKWLQKLKDEWQKEDLDVEEGEIITKVPNMEASVSRRDVSGAAALTDSMKKRKSRNGDGSDRDIGGCDSQRILATLAKMEKRKERFKQPISTKIEEERSMKLNNDTIVNMGDMKQHRPARKRRWNGT